MRVTRVTVRGMFGRAARAAIALGIDVSRWVLQEGEVTQPWSLRERDEHGSGWGDPFGSDGYLGTSTREAYDALHAMARAWELTARVRAEAPAHPVQTVPFATVYTVHVFAGMGSNGARRSGWVVYRPDGVFLGFVEGHAWELRRIAEREGFGVVELWGLPGIATTVPEFRELCRGKRLDRPGVGVSDGS